MVVGSVAYGRSGRIAAPPEKERGQASNDISEHGAEAAGHDEGRQCGVAKVGPAVGTNEIAGPSAAVIRSFSLEVSAICDASGFGPEEECVVEQKLLVSKAERSDSK